ncbi:hypothetical protein T265_04449 [Opisthorchis viverrini]|uniref:Uncharacterized protein n=1 Tax=Opisthorchis viverrini TaxID=6198 RepID=A0A074ZMZ7_OPIVI|nr:hypothetical protein T265_04449 [Opisthorchis viverrini]KER28758.1 hypothetical protein T265_04449 [Opisthorchis viverrini]
MLASEPIDVDKLVYLDSFISAETIIIDSMTSVCNTDDSLPYRHDLFESLFHMKNHKAELFRPVNLICITTVPEL